MKIIFICGSLEPGRDGVGDYTRTLASEFARRGNHVAALALNDTYLGGEVLENEQSEGIDFQILRIPSNWGQQKRFQRAKEWIELRNPDWLSLQFVLFSFHTKGISFTLNGWLKWLGKGRRWHIMFHELWIGMDTKSSKIHTWWGLLQQKLIRNLLIKLSPKVIHTQTRLYQALLIELGFPTQHLPLFGSIPFVDEEIATFNKCLDVTNWTTSISLVLFGGIYPDAPIREFSVKVSNYEKKYGVSVCLILVGRSGPEQKKWVAIWKSAGLIVKVMGEQPIECISKILSGSSLGISTTPIALAEKSSTIAAMLEHGLSIICISRPWQDKNMMSFSPPLGIYDYNSVDFELLISNIQKFRTTSRLEEIASKLANTLNLFHLEEAK